MIGTTRPQVNFLPNKFRKLGYIQYDSKIHVNNSLLSIVVNIRLSHYRHFGTSSHVASVPFSQIRAAHRPASWEFT
jgi:CRP/FNR family transcriptional regulator, cyclic AMP receptor protein